MSGFMKASVAVGQGREDTTVRIQREVLRGWRRALQQRAEGSFQGTVGERRHQ